MLTDRNTPPPQIFVVTADNVQIPRDLWAEIYDSLLFYGSPKSWECYSHKLAGILPADAGVIRHTKAQRVLDALPPALFEATLLSEMIHEVDPELEVFNA